MIPITPVIPGLGVPPTIFAKDQPQYQDLPGLMLPNGVVITRWRFSWSERLRLLLTGDLWLTVLTFGRPLQPVKLETSCPIVLSADMQEEGTIHG